MYTTHNYPSNPQLARMFRHDLRRFLARLVRR
jgi:hypothetical protein